MPGSKQTKWGRRERENESWHIYILDDCEDIKENDIDPHGLSLTTYREVKTKKKEAIVWS